MLTHSQEISQIDEKRRRLAAILLVLVLLVANSCVCSSGLGDLSAGKYSRVIGETDSTLRATQSATLLSGTSLEDGTTATRTPGRLTQMIITRTPATATGMAAQNTSNPYNTVNPTGGTRTTARPTATRTPQPTMTWFIRYFPTRTPLVFPTRTPTRTRTPQPTYTASKSPTISATLSTITPSQSPTPSQTLTHTPTTTLTPTPTEVPTLTPTPRPDQVAFSADADGDGSLDLLLMNPDGSGAQVVLQDSSNTLVCDWSPDGVWLVFEAQIGDPLTRQLYRIHPDGSDQSILAGLPAGENSQASWSPDGGWIVFRNAAPSGQADLYLIRADGSSLLQLTNTAADERYPDWSPDGSTVIFVSNADGTDKVYSMEVAALLVPVPPAPPAPVLRIDPGSGNSLAWPRWSGDQIVFASHNGTQSDILIVNVFSPGDFTNLTNPDGTDPFNDVTPAWSRDGALILFVSDRSGANEIYSVAASGGALNLISNTYTGEQRPNWLP